MTSAPPMKTWTVAVVQQWIKSFSNEFGPTDTVNAIKGCIANDVDGKKLLRLSRNASQLANTFDVSQGSAIHFCVKIKERKKKDVNRWIVKSTNPSVALSEFHLNVFLNSKRIKLNEAVNVDTSIADAKLLLYNQEMAPIMRNDAELKRKMKCVTLISGGTVLDDNKTLGYYNITNDNNLIIFRSIVESKVKDVEKKTEFHLNIFFKSKRIQLKAAVTASTTVQKVKELIYEESIAHLSSKSCLKGMTLLYRGEVLESASTLGKYNIISDNNLIVVRYTSAGS